VTRATAMIATTVRDFPTNVLRHSTVSGLVVLSYFQNDSSIPAKWLHDSDEPPPTDRW